MKIFFMQTIYNEIVVNRFDVSLRSLLSGGLAEAHGVEIGNTHGIEGVCDP